MISFFENPQKKGVENIEKSRTFAFKIYLSLKNHVS
jgi:hypothetical protein